MSRKILVKPDNNVDVRFASWYKMMVDLISPKNYFGVAGRGTAKTTDILADRAITIGKDMPGAYFSWTADTYTNALDNIVPGLIEGWGRKGWRQGVDYVTDEAPPSHFKLPYKQPLSYKHTISTRYGNFYILSSMDVPASLLGNSYQHSFGDETKRLDFEKIKKLLPALRGYPAFGHSVYYRGMSFTTDMPNIVDGDYDWILGREKDMDVQQVKDILNVAITLNQVKCELYNAIRDNDMNKAARLQKQYQRWLINWVRVRKDSTLFYMVSSFANADILTPGYFADSLEALGIEEFKASIVTLKPTLKKGEKFYVALGEHHFFNDGILKEYYDKYKIGDDVKPSSLALRYVDHNRALDAGVDFGDMCSMVTGQELGNYAYLFKNFYTLPPESSKELANQFLDFYEHHKRKVLNLYYDRSGNQYSRIRKDWASELKHYIEKRNGVSKTGWTVNLMNKNQATILHEEEYLFIKNMLGGFHKNLPSILIDRFGCRELKSSLEISKTKIKTNSKTGSKSIHKDKSSEKLPDKQKPMYSTNFSDAFKYFCYRKKWVEFASKRRSGSMDAPSVV